MAEGGVVYKRGLALLFDQTFKRDGTEKDVAALKEVFNSMNVVVEEYTSLTPVQIKNQMNLLKENAKRFEEFDYLIIVNLSHGTDDDCLEIPNEENVFKKVKLHKVFLNPLFNIKELDGKLKWFIKQSCAGDGELISKADTDGDETYFTKYYLISHASSEGVQVYRHIIYGSPYIQVLCEQLRELRATCGVLEILDRTAKKVPQKLEELKAIENIKKFTTQKPKYEKNLVEDFFFFLE